MKITVVPVVPVINEVVVTLNKREAQLLMTFLGSFSPADFAKRVNERLACGLAPVKSFSGEDSVSSNLYSALWATGVGR